MTTSGVLATVAILGLGGAGVGLYVQNRDLARRLDELAVQAAGRTERPASGAPASGPTLQGTPATHAEVVDLKQSLEGLARRLAAQEQRAGKPGPDGAPTVFVGEAFEQGVRAVLDRVQDEPVYKQKVAEAAGKPAIDKKPTFAALSQFLALDGTQEATFRRDLEDAQGELMALLADRRPDGRVLLEEIGLAETLPPNDPKRTEVFLDLFQLKIPGTDQTYVQRVVSLATAFRKKADVYLKPEQREKFAGADLDLFGVKMN